MYKPGACKVQGTTWEGYVHGEAWRKINILRAARMAQVSMAGDACAESYQ